MFQNKSKTADATMELDDSTIEDRLNKSESQQQLVPNIVSFYFF
jgi:hypothetical protein